MCKHNKEINYFCRKQKKNDKKGKKDTFRYIISNFGLHYNCSEQNISCHDNTCYSFRIVQDICQTGI